MAKAILVNFDRLKNFDLDKIKCSYPNHLEDNNGIVTLARNLSFIQICRKCKLALCIDACPYNALERMDNGIIRKHNFACRSCKSCANACPFGVINFEYMSYIDSVCDFCLGRLKEGEVPLCISSIEQEDILYYGEFKEDEENFIFKINDNLYVKAMPWKQG